MGGINENMRNSAALSQAEVTLKLNKKQNQPIWAFDIKGYTVSKTSSDNYRSHCPAYIGIYRHRENQ